MRRPERSEWRVASISPMISGSVTAFDTSAPVSEVEQTVSAGSSGLTYDAASDQYVLTWKTDKAWKGTCRQLTLKFNDGGGTYTASFRFK